MSMAMAMSQPIPRPIDLLLTGGYVLTLDESGTHYYPGSVAVDGGHIVAVGPSQEVDPAHKSERTVSAQDHVIMPGLVNIHGHASNSLIRGLGRDLPLDQWLHQVCWPCMAQAQDDDLYNGVLLSCLEMLGNGVTTFADMWVGVGISAEAVAASGQRAMLAHNIKDFGDPRRGEQELAVALDAQHRWHGFADGRVSVGLGPHSVYVCQRELLAACAQNASREGIHLQIHGSETAAELAWSQETYGRSPIALMEEVGMLGARTVVAHAVHVDEVDIRRLLTSGSAVAHNIASNLKLASGIAPVQRYLDAGVPVGLGTDGPGSNDSLDPLADLKHVSLVQKVATGDATSVPAYAALEMATRVGAQALGLASEIGSLEVGKQADIILIDLDRPHFTPHHFDYPPSIAALLVYCGTGKDVDTVIVGGRILLQDSEPVALQREPILAAAQRSSEQILRRAGLL